MNLSSLERAASIVAVVLIATAGTITASPAGNVSNGRKIAAVKCQMCHGLDGQAKLPDAPNLAGQTEQYIVAQLNAYRDKTRKNDMMSLVVPPLSENDVADLAAYYSAIEVKIVKVPGE